MTLEEKLKAISISIADQDEDGEPINDRLAVELDKALSICQQEIDEACKKQREICAKEYLRDKGYSDTTQSVISTIILNAPSPKER